jgi:serine/threonine protein kinase
MEVFDKIRTHQVSYPDNALPELVALLEGLMARDPEKRLQIVDALKSPFLEGTVART